MLRWFHDDSGHGLVQVVGRRELPPAPRALSYIFGDTCKRPDPRSPIYMLSNPALVRISVCLLLLSLVNWSFMGLLVKGLRGFGSQLSFTRSISITAIRPFCQTSSVFAMVCAVLSAFSLQFRG
jgi:hypothetical protein